ncbi:Hpt domain-containing protein [Agrobacterium sp. ES01]|uniref:Hpt domain-containing protein n=1 Tax=Agrobacterium sp. ES01 TaxID=3420714 RepID=UPI003D0FC436
MAALNIAFEAPDNSVGYRHGQPRPINLVQLAIYAKGDKQRELEVLQAFARQARHCLTHFISDDHEQVLAAAEKLKKAALSVGADRVADAAQALESQGIDPASIAVAGAAIVEAENFIQKLNR